jgi:hypothetical protein
MFTGIVAAVGRIEKIEPFAGDQAAAGVHLTIHAGGLDLSDVGLGDSIAIQGACMTVQPEATTMSSEPGCNQKVFAMCCRSLASQCQADSVLPKPKGQRQSMTSRCFLHTNCGTYHNLHRTTRVLNHN